MPAAPADASHDERISAVVAALDHPANEVSTGVPLGPLTTYRVGGPAAVFVRVNEPAGLEAVAQAVQNSALPPLVVGRGSNLLIADAGFDGIAISLGEFSEQISIDSERSVVTAGSAVRLPVLARQTAAAGLTGFEWAVGVPGSIGGAIRMNAGGHGSDMSASLLDVDVVDLADAEAGGAVQRRSADELGLRFRGSGLGPPDVALSARLQLAPGEIAVAEAEIKEIVSWRRANQPGGQNAGSVFVNPVPGEISAGLLIDRCGLRGLRMGSATVSDVHANFIQADDGGSADDVVRLMQHVRATVLEQTGYAMRSEIRLIGFEEPW